MPVPTPASSSVCSSIVKRDADIKGYIGFCTPPVAPGDGYEKEPILRNTFTPRRLGRPGGLAVLVLVLAACSGGTPSAQSSGSTSSGSSAAGGSTPDHGSLLERDLQTPEASLTGAGSTFDQPFFTRAFYTYNRSNPKVTVNYASIGSGGGISQFQAGTVNFGASDVPMTSAEMAAAKGGPVLQVPVALGGEAIAYHVPGLRGGLKMTGPLLADIYLGKVTSWNDPQIARLNPGVKLPSEKITVVHRSDGSGTTYIFSDYLSHVAPPWSRGPGTGKTVTWPVGLGGKGNEGVAGLVSQTPGAIGYVELAYALQNNFTFFRIQNAAGNFVQPSLQSVAADAAQKPDVTAQTFSIVDEGGATSYPISGYSWGLVYAHQSSAATAEALAKVFDWLTHQPGQSQAASIDYVPLPPNIQQLARQTILRISVGGRAAIDLRA
jgi:phosphate transport system substrate-binding protein